MKKFADMTEPEREDLLQRIHDGIARKLASDMSFILILGNHGTGDTMVIDNIGDDAFLAKVFSELAGKFNLENN